MMHIFRTRRMQVVLLAMLTASFLLLFLSPGFFALPSADDFSNSLSIRTLQEAGASALDAAVDTTVNGFMKSGFSLIYFFLFFFSPFSNFGIVGLRITIILINLLFFTSLFVFIRTAFQEALDDRDPIHHMWVYLLVLVALVGIEYNSEFFSWMTCSFGYALPISGMLLGTACYIKASLHGGVWRWIGSVGFGMLGAIASVQISALTCGCYLLIWLLLVAQKRGGGREHCSQALPSFWLRSDACFRLGYIFVTIC